MLFPEVGELNASLALRETGRAHLAGLHTDNSRVLVAFLLLLLFTVDALKLCLITKIED